MLLRKSLVSTLAAVSPLLFLLLNISFDVEYTFQKIANADKIDGSIHTQNASVVLYDSGDKIKIV